MKTESKPNLFIHLIYSGSFLLGIIAIISYLVWSKHQITIQHNIEIQQIEQHAVLQNQMEQAKKARVLACLQNAAQAYTADWATACREHAKDAEIRLINCNSSSEKSAKFIAGAGGGGLINYQDLYQNYAAQCNASLENPNPKPNCLLPNSMANGINAALQKAEQLCTIIS
jgi:hypothetical protein